MVNQQIKQLKDKFKNKIKGTSTGDNFASDNFIVRAWSRYHYDEKNNKFKFRYHGSVTEIYSGKVKKFHSPSGLLNALETLYKEVEKYKRKHKFPQKKDFDKLKP